MKLFLSLIFLCTSLFLQADFEVHTSSGIVDGYKKNRVVFWEDIPYALPPIGELRWKAPRELNSQKSLVQRKDNNYCVQRPSSLGGPGGEGAMVGTEDCLYLDITGPSKKINLIYCQLCFGFMEVAIRQD